MSDVIAKKEEPTKSTGRYWEIPRQGPYNWLSKVATPGQYPGGEWGKKMKVNLRDSRGERNSKY